MAKRIGAGDLRERVVFASRGPANDGGGGPFGAWADQFTVWAQFTHLRGGETVIAERLSGRHSLVIRVRASSQTRPVTTDWQARDARTGQKFNIRDVTPTTDRVWIDFLVQTQTS